ncbi:TrmH family RNA methyltransferase [Psychroflexus aestuariivivens]|uniref:TrmH family RNA methyltransferase n=1 Tax=Psychroflexus aestuariivivens TaxID=1795040 RepID=UPI000FD98632|nr:TrmH family RNA methyltransferase [Psychroflexus aestuariivivens]
MKQYQLEHQDIENQKNSIKVELFLEKLNSPANLGAIFRNAEAFGVKKIWLNKSNMADLRSSRFKRTSRSTEKNLHIEFYDNPIEVLKEVTQIKIGIEITSESKNIYHIQENIQTCTLVLGNEIGGISKEVISILDSIYHIPMFGLNSSINVAQSCGIALYELNR